MENHRKFLKENGYCNFELKEYSEEFAKYLEQFKCSPTKNMKDSFNSLRLDTITKTNPKAHHQKTFETFDLVKKYADEVLSEDGLHVKQFWYHKGIYEEYKNYDINEEYIRDFFRNLGRYLYDNEKTTGGDGTQTENKYGFKIDVNNNENNQRILNNILNKYNKYITYIKWQPQNDKNEIVIVCKNYGRIFSLKMNETIIFQKNTSQEAILIKILDHVHTIK
jgi:hypothetical protein